MYTAPVITREDVLIENNFKSYKTTEIPEKKLAYEILKFHNIPLPYDVIQSISHEVSLDAH